MSSAPWGLMETRLRERKQILRLVRVDAVCVDFAASCLIFSPCGSVAAREEAASLWTLSARLLSRFNQVPLARTQRRRRSDRHDMATTTAASRISRSLPTRSVSSNSAVRSFRHFSSQSLSWRHLATTEEKLLYVLRNIILIKILNVIRSAVRKIKYLF